MTKDIHLDCISSRDTRQIVKDTLQKNNNLFSNVTANYRTAHMSANILDISRQEIGEAIGIEEGKSIHFTSGPEESANWAIKGLAWKFAKKRNKFLFSETESTRISNPLNWLTKHDFRVQPITMICDENLSLNCEELKEKIDEKVTAVCLEFANSEIGFLNKIQDVVEIVNDYSHSAKIICDLSSQIGRGLLKVEDLGIDFGIIDSQSFGGPNGSGALYINPNLRIESLIHGDHSESGKRAGAQDVATIAAMGSASKEMAGNLENEITHIGNLTQKTYNMLENTGNDCKINTPKNQLTHGIVNFTPGPISSEILVQEMSNLGYSIAHSGGCSSENGLPSHVLKSIGLSDDEALSSVKISYDHNTRWEDIEKCLILLEEIVVKHTN